MNLKSKIREIPDFPKKGILFYDITTLLKDARAFRYCINQMVNHYISQNMHFDKVVSAESRGFIFGSVLACEMHAGFVPIRKPGKLPYKTLSHSYELEYGNDTLEVHEDAIQPGEKVLFVDDLLATGGTALAACKLIEKLGGDIVNLSFLIELTKLKGREKLKGYDVFSLVQYEE